MIPGLDIILGGVTGLIGNAFTTWFKYKNAKMEYDHDEKMIGLKSAAMVQEAQMKIQIVQAEIEGEIEVADAEAFTKSQEVGSKQLFHERWIEYLMTASEGKWYAFILRFIASLISALFALIDFLNGLMRPALTIYLVGMSTWITKLSWSILEKAGVPALSAAEALAVFSQVTSTIIYLSVSAVTWWFGDRTMSKFLQQQGAKRNRTRPGITGRPKPPVIPTGQGGGGDVDY